jgi:uncharacterized protein (TIGR03437 family)
MKFGLLFATLLLCGATVDAATFGTAVAIAGGPTDIVLDEARGRLYIVDSTQNRIDVYSLAQKRFLSAMPVGAQPLSAAMARSGKYLYVSSYQSATLEIVDLDSAVVVGKVSLPAAPEGVAVGGDERVLITTVGSGANNADNRLMLYDPNAAGEEALRAIATTLPAPTTPPTTTTSSRIFMSTRSNLAASADGRYIIGLNNPSTSTRQLFVFEVASGAILRSRTLSSISNVLSVSPDGEKFMAGLSLFETSTLAIVAQQNAANSMYPFAANANFNTQANQGGSVFAPNGSVLYSAFNIAPVQNPAANANATQLMLNDPDNMLIRLGLQLPENLTGNMVIDSAGANIYALSQSGFMIIPVSTIYDNPVAALDSTATLLVSDACGVNASQSTSSVTVRNIGKGRLTATAQVNTTGTAVTSTFPIGGQPGGGGAATPIGGGGPGGGAGGGAPGGQFPIVLPVGPGNIGGGTITIPTGAVPGAGQTLTNAQQAGVSSTAPTVRTRRTDTETIFDFSFNSAAARSMGTQTPTDFLVQSTEAINIPFRVRAYQNYRYAEASGNVLPASTSVSTAESLVDMVLDSARQRLYIANSGMNRVEVFDTSANQFLAPIKVGQLPRSLALAPGGSLLYVANSGGESISNIDLDKVVVSGKVKFPPVPYNASFALITPSVIAATLSGLQIVMSDGTLWHVVDNEAAPRKTNSVTGSTAITAPRTMAAAPGGEYAVLLGGNGTAYLFDASSDEFVLSQTVAATPIQGYYGPITVGPRGQYVVVNGRVLNASLTPINTAIAVTSSRPVSAVSAVSATMLARFTQPARTSATAAVTDVPTVELVDATTGLPRGSTSVLEGPLAAQVGTQRSNVDGRTMAVDATTNTAYLFTASGLTVASISTVQQGPGPGSGPGAPPVAASSSQVIMNTNGVVNMGSYKTTMAPGSVVAIFGQNLASADTTTTTAPAPKLAGGTCVTLDDVALPVFMTSSAQINVQIPADTKTGTHRLVVRAVDRHIAGATTQITLSKYAPAVFINPETNQAAVFHADGGAVSTSDRAKRDEPLTLYATGLGVTHGGTVTAGNPAPESPAALTDKVQVYFGDPRMSQSEAIVDWSGLEPGEVGIYKINLRIPGAHMKGDALPVTIRIGGVDSPATGAIPPTIAVE